jgi:ATP-dependent protease ClpP protease subunit
LYDEVGFFKFIAPLPMKLRSHLLGLTLVTTSLLISSLHLPGYTQASRPLIAQSNLQPNRSQEVGVINFFAGVNQKSLRSLIVAVNELQQAGISDILINFNSYGGDSDAGLAAYNYLQSLPITIRTHNLGYVASASVKIFCAGKIRTAAPQSHFLIHYGTMSLGNNLTALQIQGLLNSSKNRSSFTTEILATCMGQSRDQITNFLRQEAVFSATEARQLGLVQQILPQQSVNLSIKHQILIRDE